MARKARKSRRRRRGSRGGNRDGARLTVATNAGRGQSGPLEKTRIIGDLPPLPIVTRLLDHLRRRVGSEDDVWQRGMRYAEDGRVAYLKLRGENVEAGVKGSRRYLVSLSWPAGSPERFDGRCTCPYARKGICKHMVSMAMTLWFATQKTEEEEARAELAAAVGAPVVMQGASRASDARRPRSGVAAGSALPAWMASLLDADDSVPPPPAHGPALALNAEEPWVTYDLLPGQGEPMPIEVRVPRMGAGMRPTRGRRVYEMDRPGLKDLAGEVRLLPEDKVAMSLIAAHEAPTGGAAAPWDPTILDRILRVLAHTREVRVHGEPVRVVTEPVELGLVVADHGDGVRMWAERRRGPDEPAPEGERLPPEEGPVPGLRHFVAAHPAWVHLVDGTLRPLTPAGTRLLRVFGTLRAADCPQIADEDLTRFREREWPVMASRYPVELATERLPRVVAPPPMPRLYLIEPDELTLEVRPAFAYALPGEEIVEAGPDSPHFLQSARGEGMTVQRNSAREAELLASVLTAVAGARGIDASELDPTTDPWSIRLEGEDAMSFLAEQLSALEATFAIFGDESLTRLRVERGGLEANVRVQSHTDWFDLKLGFTAGEGLASAADVLRAWRKQKRFVQLDNGQYARIPEQWLARFGMLVDEAESARRELRGKMPRYMVALGAALEDAAGSFEADERFASWKERVVNAVDLPEVPPPKGLNAELRPYQLTGYRWLCWLGEEGFGGCLADDMGLGKTIQALAFILREKERGATDGLPVLVVAPTSVLFNWKHEAARFCPSLKVVVYQGMNRKSVYKPDAKRQPDVVVTSYPVMRIDSDILSSREWHAAILDESQHIKNADSQTAASAFRLNARKRFVMTGTPLENRLDDLWSQYHFVMPGFLGRRRGFLQSYAVRPGSKVDPEILDGRLRSLRDRIRPFLMRRLKQDVATELPERTEMVLHVELSADEQRIYNTVRDAYRAQVFSAVSEKGMRGARLTILEALLRLRQASCHPSLLPFDEAKAVGDAHGSSKLRTLVETLQEIVAEGHKALVFSQWTSLLDLTQTALENVRLDTARLDGSTKDRGAVVERFQSDDGPPVFLLSLKAGGVGLNLTAADYVVHLDPWWNPAVEAQANDRAHRIGQTRPVVIIKLVAAGTVEEKVVELQSQKRALFDATVSEGKSLGDLLGEQEVTALLDVAPADADPATEAEDECATRSSRRSRVRRRRRERNGKGGAARARAQKGQPKSGTPQAGGGEASSQTPAPEARPGEEAAAAPEAPADAPATEALAEAKEEPPTTAVEVSEVLPADADGEPADDGDIDPTLRTILALIREREGVTTREVTDALGLSADIALMSLRDLIARGLVARIGRGPSVRYVPTEAA